jgi:hypothetical protein
MALPTAFGCGGGPTPCVVSGTVLVDGQPTEGVYVVLHPLGRPASEDPGTARTGEDGSFSLVADSPGESSITAFRPKVKVEGDDVIEGADLFAGRYRDPQRPISRINVREGETKVPPIELTGRPSGRGKSSHRR